MITSSLMSINKSWTRRSRQYKDKIEGVLPKSFPKLVNEYLDEWMYGQVNKRIKLRHQKVLDLGCGYGRISARILKDHPKLRTKGIDVAKPYVDLYNKTLAPKGTAVVGDIRNLPFKSGDFDVVFMVTTLMYLKRVKDQKKAFSEIFRVLKPGGRFVFIERNTSGYALVNFFGLIPLLRGNSKKEIDSISFSADRITRMVVNVGGTIEEKTGIPFWTLSIHFNFLLNKLGLLTKCLLNMIRKLDKKFSGWLTPSMYISYSGAKK